MVKKFLCNVNPAELTFGIIIILALSLEAWFIGIKSFGLIVLVFAGICAIVFSSGYGLYRLIKWLQTKCLKS